MGTKLSKIVSHHAKNTWSIEGIVSCRIDNDIGENITSKLSFLGIQGRFGTRKARKTTQPAAGNEDNLSTCEPRS